MSLPNFLLEHIEDHLVIHSVGLQRGDIVIITIEKKLEGLVGSDGVDSYLLPLGEIICREICGVFFIWNEPYCVIRRVVSQEQKSLILLVWRNSSFSYGVKGLFVAGIEGENKNCCKEYKYLFHKYLSDLVSETFSEIVK